MIHAALRRWLMTPSKHDALISVMREQHRLAADAQHAQTALMSKLVESVSAQSAVFQQYLTMISTANATPQTPRVMMEVDEAMLERRRNMQPQYQESVAQVLGADAEQLLMDAFHDVQAGL